MIALNKSAGRMRVLKTQIGALAHRLSLPESLLPDSGRSGSGAMQITQNRRTFMAGLSAAGSAGLFNMHPSSAAIGEPPPETTTVRLGRPNAYCWASVFLAGELLRGEGITDVQYVEGDPKVDN